MKVEKSFVSILFGISECIDTRTNKEYLKLLFMDGQEVNTNANVLYYVILKSLKYDLTGLTMDNLTDEHNKKVDDFLNEIIKKEQVFIRMSEPNEQGYVNLSEFIRTSPTKGLLSNKMKNSQSKLAESLQKIKELSSMDELASFMLNCSNLSNTQVKAAIEQRQKELQK